MPSSERLKVGDVISVRATTFGEQWAKDMYPSDWYTKKIEGVVEGKTGSKWQLHFVEEDDTVLNIVLSRKDIVFVSRPAAPAAHLSFLVDSDDEEELATAAEDGDAANTDSSAEESEGDRETFFDEEADHEEKDGSRVDHKKDIMHGWKQDNDFALDQRAAVYETRGHADPVLKNDIDPTKVSLFELGKNFLPSAFLVLMAAGMTEKGRELARNGDARFSEAWVVSVDDLLQWIGVWMYMLAFDQPGGRAAFWTEPKGGYGPRHRLAAYLSMGKNGEKGPTWFEKMVATFFLPQYNLGDNEYTPNDPFVKTRRWWNSLRDGFFSAVEASWLLVLDESMVRWTGVGMPGLMVILRKPTPIGLELHTLCCAICGILVWFEVYEGKEAMEKKPFCDKYGKSIALSLRMLVKYFGTGRVLIADSWFGSVACAIALLRKGVFSVMNVKTATKNYPKDQLMNEVGEIKGNTAEARAERRERRGKSVAYTQKVNVGGGREVSLLAAGHNKKVPLLLICTCMTMLPGEEHNKTWKVNQADGSVEKHTLKTSQPEVHALYRLWMNIVDLHNKLRQGVVSMADVWHTTSWDKRHFAEGLGFWEVNVFKAFTFWCQTRSPKKMPHADFRARLAWAFLTLGKVPYPADNSAGPSSSAASFNTPGEDSPTVPLPGSSHTYKKAIGKTGSGGKTCGYYGAKAYWTCATCFETLGVVIAVCGPKSKRGLHCRHEHANGVHPTHSTWVMTSPGARAGAAGRAAAKRHGKGRAGSSDDDEPDDDDDEDDEDDNAPRAAGMSLTRSAKKTKHATKEAKKAAQAAASAAALLEQKRMGRLARNVGRNLKKT